MVPGEEGKYEGHNMNRPSTAHTLSQSSERHRGPAQCYDLPGAT